MTSVEFIPIGRPAQGRAVHGFRASDLSIVWSLGISSFVIEWPPFGG